MSAHAVYAPSSAHRWIPCTASAEGIEALGERESGEEAIEGTEAHDEIERILGEFNNGQPSNTRFAYTPDPEHPAAYGIALVLDYVWQLPPGRMWVEQRVKLTDQIWGRCDIAHWHAESATLTIIDYKNGIVDVQAKDNPQLLIYAAASIYEHQLPAKWVRLVVVQPNSFTPPLPGDVRDFKQDIVSVAKLFAFAQMVAAIPTGPKTFAPRVGEHCRDCPLFGMCPTSKDVLTNLQLMLARPVSEVTPAQISIFMSAKKPLEHYFEALWKHGNKQALGGHVPPGMKLVTSTKHRTWRDEDAARGFILDRYGVKELSPPTPAQAEKLGVTDAELEVLAFKPPGGPALAFESDKRPAYVAKTGAQMFASVTHP